MSLGGTHRLWSLVASSVLAKTSHPLLHLRSLFSLSVFFLLFVFVSFHHLGQLLVVPLFRPLDSLDAAHQHVPLLLDRLHPLQQPVVDPRLEGVPPRVRLPASRFSGPSSWLTASSSVIGGCAAISELPKVTSGEPWRLWWTFGTVSSSLGRQWEGCGWDLLHPLPAEEEDDKDDDDKRERFLGGLDGLGGAAGQTC